MANALTKIKADGLTADLIDETKIADNGIDSEHYNDGSIDHEHLANDAVDADILADNSVGLAAMAHGTDGQIITYDASGAPIAVGPGTDGQVLTSTGAGSPPAFEAIPAGGAATNLIINGAMNVAQRAATSTSGGYQVIDRWQLNDNNTNVTITQAQHALTSSDTGPWAKGFRNSYHASLSGAGNSLDGASYARLKYVVEAQDMACSGWDYTSASSYITLSFWFKCSTNQTFHGKVHTEDGTGQAYPFSFTATGNDTWTKITKTIPGNTNVTIDNNTGYGLGLYISLHHGSNYTGSPTLNTWAAHSSSAQFPTDASTWLTAGASTFEMTGVQLEVGDTASDFAHKTYGDELQECLRYYHNYKGDNGDSIGIPGSAWDTNFFSFMLQHPVPMRAIPTLIGTSTNARFQAENDSDNWTLADMAIQNVPTDGRTLVFAKSSSGSGTVGQAGNLQFNADNSILGFSAEL